MATDFTPDACKSTWPGTLRSWSGLAVGRDVDRLADGDTRIIDYHVGAGGADRSLLMAGRASTIHYSIIASRDCSQPRRGVWISARDCAAALLHVLRARGSRRCPVGVESELSAFRACCCGGTVRRLAARPYLNLH